MPKAFVTCKLGQKDESNNFLTISKCPCLYQMNNLFKTNKKETGKQKKT